MSAILYFLKGGYTPINKNVVVSGGDTFTLWTPITGKRVFITDLSMSTNTGGTISFFFDHPSSTKFYGTHLGGSASFSPNIGCVESTVVSGRIFGRINGNGTGAWEINATGFEIGS